MLIKMMWIQHLLLEYSDVYMWWECVHARVCHMCMFA